MLFLKKINNKTAELPNKVLKVRRETIFMDRKTYSARIIYNSSSCLLNTLYVIHYKYFT